MRKLALVLGLIIGPTLCPLASAAASAPQAMESARQARTDSQTRAEARSGNLRLKAIGASLLLPGLGQLVTGHRDRARAFFYAEGAILIAYTTFTVQGRVGRDHYIDYAERFAGVSSTERPDWYYRNLGQYSSSEDYLDDIERTARAIYGNDLEARAAYVERNRPQPDEAWRWRSEADREEFRAQRKSSRNAFRSANHVIGIALLNRLVSAVDAAILAGKDSDRHALFYVPEPDGYGYVCLGVTLN